MPGITAIIPVFRDAAELKTTLNCLAAQTMPKRKMQIIVANDGADTEVRELCRIREIDLVDIKPRRGSYFARNRALEKAEGEIIAFIDAGIIVPKDWLEKAIRTLGPADYLAAEVDIADVPRPTAAQAYEKANSYPVSEYLKESHFGVTAGLLVKKTLLKKIGPFHENLDSGGDLEFGDRVHRAGFSQVYLAEPVLLHRPRRAVALFLKQFRVKKGHAQLALLYPQRFRRKKTITVISGLARALLPPRPASARIFFLQEHSLSFFRRYFFLWALKFCRALADFTALFAKSPSPNKKAAQIKWHCLKKHGR